MSQAQSEVPKYRVLQRSFFAPHTLEPGTEILYEGRPGNHLLPLNEAAERRMEEFYSETFPERDMRTKELTGKEVAPRATLRPFKGKPEESVDHGIVVTAQPTEDPLAMNVMSLAEMGAMRKPTDQRPPGLKPPPAVPVRIESPSEEKK